MSDETSPCAGELYDHFKGGRYRVIAVGHLSESRDQEMVVYASLEKGTTWIRPLSRPHLEADDCWNDLVDWSDGVKRPRFVRANEASIQDHNVIRIAEIQARVEKATPGPWSVHDDSWPEEPSETVCIVLENAPHPNPEIAG